ncbi:ATP/GTP-binding protein, partial [Streptomyces varsoviensis]
MSPRRNRPRGGADKSAARDEGGAPSERYGLERSEDWRGEPW